MSNQELPSHIVRMQQEYEQLTSRTGKLHNFMNSDAYMDLEQVDRRLLELQFAAMIQYQFFLEQRLHFALQPFMQPQVQGSPEAAE